MKLIHKKLGFPLGKKKGGMRCSDYAGGNKVFAGYNVVGINWGQERLLKSDQ